MAVYQTAIYQTAVYKIAVPFVTLVAIKKSYTSEYLTPIDEADSKNEALLRSSAVMALEYTRMGEGGYEDVGPKRMQKHRFGVRKKGRRANICPNGSSVRSAGRTKRWADDTWQAGGVIYKQQSFEF